MAGKRRPRWVEHLRPAEPEGPGQPLERGLDRALRPLGGEQVAAEHAQQPRGGSIVVAATEQVAGAVGDRIEERDGDHDREAGHDRQVDRQQLLREALQAHQRRHVEGHPQADQDRVTERPAADLRGKEDALGEDGVGRHHHRDGDQRDADPRVGVSRAGQEADHPAGGADHDRGERGHQLAPPGAVPAGAAESGRDPDDGANEDEDARPDPRPAEDLARDARQLEVRGRDRPLLIGEEDRAKGHRPAQGIRRQQRDALGGRAAALDGQRQRDVQRAGRQEEGADVLDRVDRPHDGQIVGQALDDDRHRPGDQVEAQEREDSGSRLTPRAGHHDQAQPGGQDGGHAMRGELELICRGTPSPPRRRTAGPPYDAADHATSPSLPPRQASCPVSGR